MKHSFFFAAILIALCHWACKKENAPITPAKPACRIVKTIEPSDITYLYSYDKKGRLVSIDHYGSITTFTYQGDSIIKQGLWRSVYKLNREGLLASERRTYDKDGLDWETRDYQYDGVQLKKATINSNSGNKNTRTFKWSNGNMMSEDIIGDNYSEHTNYEYYTDKLFAPGDSQYQGFLDNGVISIRNKNLTKKRSITYTDTYGTEAGVLEYSYNFDSEGRIISMTVTDLLNPTPSTYSYEYACD